MNIDILLGKTTDHLVPFLGTSYLVHKLIAQDLRRLKDKAQEAGFDMQIISSFRQYSRQLTIWNEKVLGRRPVLDYNGKVLDISRLTNKELLYAIMRWSAVPGSSRHHWGTDIDIYDAKTQNASDVKLTPEECEGNGPAAELNRWLDQQINQYKSFGFYRPYAEDRGGVAPEKWHLSHCFISQKISQQYTHSIFKKHIEGSEILLKKELLEESHDIFERFILNVNSF